MSWVNYTDGLATLFEQGGLILWAILAASLLLWYLLVERYLFHIRDVPHIREQLRAQWNETETGDLPTKLLHRRMYALVDDLRTAANKNILALQALIAILPLLGLLGTVSGMIKVFEVITIFGSGNTRGMASGISEALVTTMAGLFTALSGLFLVTDLENRAENVAKRFEAQLVEDQ